MKSYESFIFEKSTPGRKAYSLEKKAFKTVTLDAELLRSDAPKLPEVYELDVLRHFTNMSMKNYGIETGMYPLGSCTMKYNPKIHQDIAAMPAFSGVHPYQETGVDGLLEIYDHLQTYLSEISGMHQFTLNSYAGAHGELVGLMVMKRWHDAHQTGKTKVLVPDAAHGTNPASAIVAGFSVVELKSNHDGTVDLDDFYAKLDDEVAGIMLTNPNTLGVFERNILEISQAIHDKGGLLYYDGANLNPLLGMVRPGDMGFDIMHINLHKTFSTPHGGGGPGSGPVGVRKDLAQFLPKPVIEKTADGYAINRDKPGTIGQISQFYGNFGVYIKAYAFILTNGEHLKDIARYAVLNANYVKESLKDVYELPTTVACKHEFVFNGLKDKSDHVTTLDVAKRLLDYGVHPPTIYFPLLYKEALMIEPVETESKQTIDGFIEIMRTVAKEAKESPELVKTAPHTTIVRRLDEATAARHPVLTYDAHLKP